MAPHLALMSGRKAVSIISQTAGLLVNPGSQRFSFVIPPVAAASMRKEFGVGRQHGERQQLTELGNENRLRSQKGMHLVNLRQAHRFARKQTGSKHFSIQGIDRGNEGNVVTVLRSADGWQVGFEERGVFKPWGEYTTQHQAAEAFLDALVRDGRLRADWRSVR